MEDNNNIQRIALINGNKADHNGPVILLNLDPHIVYGLSHPAIVGKILSQGQPQELWTTKDLAHRLYEHGMKSSWGVVKHKNLCLQSRGDTFYTPLQAGPIFLAEASGTGADVCASVKIQIPGAKKTILLTNRQQTTGACPTDTVVPVEAIKTYTSFEI